MVSFEFGSFTPLHVRFEQVALQLPQRLRLLYASDLHLGHWWTARVPEQLLAAAGLAGADVILLGGDLVDNAGGLPALRRVVGSLRALAPVCAIPGNHDNRAGQAHVRAAVVEAGGRWLPDAPLEAPLWIDALPGASSGRSRVLCAHDPSIFPEAARAGYSLVLAGHLHGGQCVLAMRRGLLYPAVWFHRWHGLRFVADDSTLLVSRGAADTFPFRINCPREVILCEVS
jgi:predicted MPP superfamily phosphohydrolase